MLCTAYSRMRSLPSHVVVPGLFFICLAAILAHHEMWRDELHAWGLVVASHSLQELFTNVRQEGHPALWYLLLYGPSRFSTDPILMQALHLLIATGAVYLFFRFSPFPLVPKLGVVFGYYLLYEYAAISRSYVLGVALLFAYCAARSRLPRASPWLAVLLALLFNTNAYMALIAGVLTILDVFDFIRDPAVGRQAQVRRLTWFLSVVILGAWLAVAQAFPPPEMRARAIKWNAPTELSQVEGSLSRVWKGYVPIPRLTLSFWNSNVLDDAGFALGRWQFSSHSIQFALSIGLLFMALYLLLPTKKWLIFYAVATMALLTFMQVRYVGIRHGGHLFLVLLASLWLAASEPQTKLLRWQRGPSSVMLTLLLLAQVPAAVIAIRADMTYAFSAAKDVADYAREHDLLHLPILASRDWAICPIAVHLNHPMHYAESERKGTFAPWTPERRHLTPDDLLKSADQLSAEQQAAVLLITTFELRDRDGGLVKLASFNQQIITDERYHLYLRCPDPRSFPTTKGCDRLSPVAMVP